MNANGQAAGVGLGGAVYFDGTTSAGVYRDGVLTTFGPDSRIFDVNAAGDVVGKRWNGSVFVPFRNTSAGTVDLNGVLPGTAAGALNDNGIIVARESLALTIADQPQSVSWNGPVTSYMKPMAVDNNGWIVGEAGIAGYRHLFLYNAYHSTSFDATEAAGPGYESFYDKNYVFVEMNARGDVLGQSATDNTVLLYKKWGAFPTTRFFSTPGAATDMNSSGNVIGQYFGHSDRTFAIPGDTVYLLSTFNYAGSGFDSPGIPLAINDFNQIGGNGFAWGVQQAYLMDTQTPEPGSIGLAVGAFALLLASRRTASMTRSGRSR